MPIKVLFALLCYFTGVHSASYQESIRQQMKDDTNLNFESSGLFEKYIIGSMSNYLTPEELANLMNELVAEFPEVFRKLEFGTSYDG
jgi:hypothetical protein